MIWKSPSPKNKKREEGWQITKKNAILRRLLIHHCMGFSYLHLSNLLNGGVLLYLSGKMTVYIGATLFFLALAALLFAVLVRIRSRRAQQREEQFLSDAFSRISYEIRTPLTVILGLSRQLKEEKNLSNGNLTTYLTTIERQGKSLSELVNQLFDIAKLQSSDKSAEWKTGDITAFVEMIFENFRIYAREKEIELSFFCGESEMEADFVPDRLHKILHHLLSNAIRFSDEGSRIHLIMEREDKKSKNILIKVVDQGRGIPAEILPHIFDLFYRSPHTGKEQSAGHGIGLALVRQLTEALGGSVRVESEEGRGSTFTVALPLYKDEKNRYARWIPEMNAPLPLPTPSPEEEGAEPTAIPNENDPRATILLAEDNKDIAIYIRALFSSEQYNILHATNGEKAWEMANTQIPDLVITDEIMPKKSGTQLCREIKSSPLLNHIPVIMISAKNGECDLLEGLKSGADSYIRKPFYPEELQLSVVNLLESRQLLKEKYCRAVLKEEKTEQGEHQNAESEFLRHVTDIIYREMKNPDFTPGQLARELAISVSQLNKRLNAITGHPSSTYILQVKLSHAKKIFNTQNKTIGEVAAECGIYDVNYFSRVFKKYTGVTPTQFKRIPTH